MCSMPNQSTPEIDRLRMLPTAANPHVVPLPAAIQAVRDTEARVRADCAATYLLDGVAEARREAFREAVEALRGLLAVDDPSAWGAMNGDEAVERAADFIERSFLSPDNPEGNA